MIDLLIRIYKKYGHIFQGRLFSVVILFYKYNRISKSARHTVRFVFKNFGKIKVYGGKKSKSIHKLLSNVEYDTENCHKFIYTWDVFKTAKIHNKILGNCTINYSKIIDYSLTDYFMEGDSKFEEDNNIVLSSILDYLNKLKEYVRQSDIDNKDNIFKYIENMSNGPAESLEEALQRILIINQLQWQLGHILVGLGRLDLYLEKYECSDEEAEVLFSEFFQLLHKYYFVKSNALMGDTGQVVILGGINADGTYFCGKYTKVIIDVIQRLKLPDPKILLRISEKMPSEWWNNIVNLMVSGVGSPLISNDDQVIPRMIDFGYAKEDACNYITSACWEPIAGESYEQNNILSLNYLKPFEYISTYEDTAKINSMKELMDLYYKGLAHEISRITKYLSSIRWETDPLYSMFSDNARKTGTDVAEGGSKYNNYGILTVGMANVINSLSNIQEIVFKRRELTYSEFDGLRKKNYQGFDDLVTKLRDNKKFGCDDDEVIELVNDITSKTEKIISEYSNPFGGKIKFGLSSPHYIMDSSSFPASFDGRYNNEPFSVHISSSRGAYTELFNFASKLDYSGMKFNGNVVDYMLAPNFVKKNMQNFAQLIKVALKKGVFQMQANIIDSTILLAARKNPDEFPNLIVRVWGFNAYFNELPSEYKDFLIARAIESETAAY